jgi:HEAT repeat protein
MKTNNRKLLSMLSAVVMAAALAAPSIAQAGKGASYLSIKSAITSGSIDAIVGEVERAEKLPCGSCIELVQPLIDHDDARVRDVAGWWLAKRAVRSKVRDDMFARLTAGDSVSARNAAEVLGRFMHPDALLPLEAAIHDGSLGDDARVAATTAIGTIGVPDGKAILEGALTSESAPVRAAAAAALRHIRGNVDAVALVPLLSDGDEEVVQESALTSGAMREPAAVGALADVVSDLSHDVGTRKAAAWALGKIGDPSARDVLDAVADDDPDMLVRGAARVALRDLN